MVWATGGLKVRCPVSPHVHRRPFVQVTALSEPPWNVLDVGELQLKLQLSASGRVRFVAPRRESGLGGSAADHPGGRVGAARICEPRVRKRRTHGRWTYALISASSGA